MGEEGAIFSAAAMTRQQSGWVLVLLRRVGTTERIENKAFSRGARARLIISLEVLLRLNLRLHFRVRLFWGSHKIDTLPSYWTGSHLPSSL